MNITNAFRFRVEVLGLKRGCEGGATFVARPPVQAHVVTCQCPAERKTATATASPSKKEGCPNCPAGTALLEAFGLQFQNMRANDLFL